SAPRIASITHCCLGVVLAARGELAAAEPELRAAVAGANGAATPFNAAFGRLALLRVAQGDPAEALELARRAVLLPERDAVPHEAIVRLATALALRDLGRHDEARAAAAYATARLQAALDAL